MNNDFLFVEKYAPNKIEDCILSKSLSKYFLEVVKTKKLQNMILTGSSGVGKTSTIRALAKGLNCDYMEINGSDERSIDTIRNKVKSYSTSVSLSNKSKKILLIDEADNLTYDAQLALRGVVERAQKNCTFVYTCNYKNRIFDPLHSRTVTIDFSIPAEEKPEIAAKFYKRTIEILQAENITFDKDAVAQLIHKYFPDFRKTLNELQRYSLSGKIDLGILARTSEVKISQLIKSMKTKNFFEVRNWVVQNLNNDPSILFRKIYDSLYESAVPRTIPGSILIIGKYMYQSNFVADHEINMLACLSELISEVEWK